jgi:adenylate cyclase class IV
MKIGSIVYYKDDKTKHPYLVHDILEGGEIVLGLGQFPEIEQDFGTPKDVLQEFDSIEELLEKQEQINTLINE